MAIWRGVFIKSNVDPPALARGLANAFGVDTARVAVVAADEEWLTLPDGFEVVAETSPTCGEARLMATLFLFRNPAEVERLEGRAVVQALADGLGCTVLLPDDMDMDPFNPPALPPGCSRGLGQPGPGRAGRKPNARRGVRPRPSLKPPCSCSAWLYGRSAFEQGGGVGRARGDAKLTPSSAAQTSRAFRTTFQQ